MDIIAQCHIGLAVPKRLGNVSTPRCLMRGQIWPFPLNEREQRFPYRNEAQEGLAAEIAEWPRLCREINS